MSVVARACFTNRRLNYVLLQERNVGQTWCAAAGDGALLGYSWLVVPLLQAATLASRRVSGKRVKQAACFARQLSVSENMHACVGGYAIERVNE